MWKILKSKEISHKGWDSFLLFKLVGIEKQQVYNINMG